MTFLVVIFILLCRHMLMYFDDIIGKDLGWEVISQLLFYFAVFMTPLAMPLAVLLSSLITFGNLGEHFELTAIKSAGISLLRTIQPIFIFVLLLTAAAFYVNNNLVPKAALEAYSLLYDIRQKKPALDIREGAFYGGLPDISIKVNEKFSDGVTLKGIILYDHRKKDGNKEVTVADSGRMYTIFNERYIRFELFNGYIYTEGASVEREMIGRKDSQGETLTRSKFYKTEAVLDLSSFQLLRTAKEGFLTHRIMRNLNELEMDIGSMNHSVLQHQLNNVLVKSTYFSYFSSDSSRAEPEHLLDSTYLAKLDSLCTLPPSHAIAQAATNMARQVKSQVVNSNATVESFENQKIVYEIQWHKIIASSFMCIAMFLIGAPLGAIIKRGGLGVPFLVSIAFFIVYYILNMQGEKLASQKTVSQLMGIWTAAAIFLIIGFFFLRQARIDARIFDADVYRILIQDIRQWFLKLKISRG